MLDLKTEKEEKCKGLVFKASENNYFSDGRIVFKIEFRLQKRLSCGVCNQCILMLDDIAERMSDGYGLKLPKSINPGKLYQPFVTNISTDWETGHVDDWDLELREVSST